MSAEIDSLFRGGTRALAAELRRIVGELDDYWPLTVRQVYYQCVAQGVLENKQENYRRVSRVLTDLRRNDLVDWAAVEDRTRRTVDKRGLPDVQAFVAEQLESFLDPRYYHRCYVQNQSVYVEVATEKDALSTIMENAVWYFCVRLNVVRGQVSATMVQAMAQRFEEAYYRGKRPVLIYLGDLDPSGIAIPRALVRNMREHHGVEVELRRVALNSEQVEQYTLPVSLDAAKEADPNYRTWLREYGDQHPVELDALHPAQLTEVVQSALGAAYDMSAYDAEREREEGERRLLVRAKRDVTNLLRREHPELVGTSAISGSAS